MRRRLSSEQSGSSGRSAFEPLGLELVGAQLLFDLCTDEAPPHDGRLNRAAHAERIAGAVVTESDKGSVQHAVAPSSERVDDQSLQRPHNPPLTGIVEAPVRSAVHRLERIRQRYAETGFGLSQLSFITSRHPRRMPDAEPQGSEQSGSSASGGRRKSTQVVESRDDEPAVDQCTSDGEFDMPKR